MKREPKYYCIKTIYYDDNVKRFDGDMVFEKGQCYEKSNFYVDNFHNYNQNLIGICIENNQNSGMGFHRNYDPEYPNFKIFSDYFISLKQLRTLKLQKLNEITSRNKSHTEV